MDRRKASARAAFFVFASSVSGVAFAGPVTYDFSGIVTNYDAPQGVQVPIGSTISGIYTFNLTGGTSSGTLGSANWSVGTQGGPLYGTPLPTSSVFVTTAQVGGLFSYVSTGPSPSDSGDPYAGFESSVNGAGTSFSASEDWHAAPDIQGGSSFSISNPLGAYSAAGLPIFTGSTLASGDISEFIASEPTQIDFKVTSMKLVTAAPEIERSSAVSVMTLVAGGLAMLCARPRRRLQRAVV